MPKYRTLKQLESSLVENMEMYVHYYELSDTIFNKTRKTKRFFRCIAIAVLTTRRRRRLAEKSLLRKSTPS